MLKYRSIDGAEYEWSIGHDASSLSGYVILAPDKAIGMGIVKNTYRYCLASVKVIVVVNRIYAAYLIMPSPTAEFYVPTV